MKTLTTAVLALAAAAIVTVTPALAVQKCKTADEKDGVIMSELQRIPNFAGQIVLIWVDYCQFNGGKAFTGYKLVSGMVAAPPDFSGVLGANCNGPKCRVPAQGVAVLRQMKALLSPMAGSTVNSQSLSAVLSDALANCPADGCDVPAALVQTLAAQVKTGAEASQLVQRRQTPKGDFGDRAKRAAYSTR